MGWGVRDYPGEPPEKRPVPVCPVCGWECETIYLDTNRNPVGCDNCIDAMDAYEWEEQDE
jgi:hypothetical protein